MALKNLLTYHGGVLKRRSTVSDGPLVPPVTLLDETFDTWPLGIVGVTTWNSRMAGGQASGVSSELARHEVVTNPDLGGRMMQLTLLANTQGSAGSTAIVVPLSQIVDDIVVEFKFKFVAPYDFGLGQKFPGPAGVRPGISPSFPTGCKAVVDEGFSGRCMQATHSGRPDAAGMTYPYGTDVTEAGWTCGEDGWWTSTGAPSTGSGDNVVMTAGTWHTLSTRMRVNTVDPVAGPLSDGITTTTWDDATVYHRTNRKPRVRSDVHATHLLWHWFYGGSDATWAPETDQTIWIDYIKILAP